MDKSESNFSSPSPNSSITHGYRIERCAGLRGRIPLSIEVPVDVGEHPEQISHKTRPHPLTLNESGEERTITQMATLGEAVDLLADVTGVLKDSYQHVGKVHGDISPNTLFRDKNGRGVLVDWDHNNMFREICRGYCRDKFYGQKKQRGNR